VKNRTKTASANRCYSVFHSSVVKVPHGVKDMPRFQMIEIRNREICEHVYPQREDKVPRDAFTGEPCERFAAQKLLPRLHQPHRDYRTGMPNCQVFAELSSNIIQKSWFCTYSMLWVLLLLEHRPENIYSYARYVGKNGGGGIRTHEGCSPYTISSRAH
jgi:hypothetical protein